MTNELMKELAGYRIRAGLSIEEASEVLKIAPSSLRRVERGQRTLELGTLEIALRLYCLTEAEIFQFLVSHIQHINHLNVDLSSWSSAARSYLAAVFLKREAPILVHPNGDTWTDEVVKYVRVADTKNYAVIETEVLQDYDDSVTGWKKRLASKLLTKLVKMLNGKLFRIEMIRNKMGGAASLLFYIWGSDECLFSVDIGNHSELLRYEDAYGGKREIPINYPDVKVHLR